MKKQLVMMAAAMALYGTTALAVVTAEEVVSSLQADGYSWIEVKRGPTQIKVEAVKGTTKVEKIIDIETGRVLQTETENADPEDMGRTGVQIRDRNRDFLDDSSDDDSSDDNGSDDNGGDDDEGDHDEGDDDNGGDDDEGNDDNGGDRGGDDDEGDDDNGGDDDEGNDDNGGDRGGDDDGDDDRGDDNGGGSNDD